MKQFLLFYFVFTFLFFGLGLSQELDVIPTCGSTEFSTISEQRGGLYLSSQGTIRILVVFVRFKDDVAPHNYWSANDEMQSFMSEYIDPDVETGSTNYANLTNYFNQMSLGVNNIIGDVVYVKTPLNREDYGTPWPDRYLATKDVLQNVVDPIVNFADYDNWTYNSNYNQTNEPDGVVDMIIMIWRGIVITDDWLGKANLADAGSPFTVEGGTITIKIGFGSDNGSCITVQDWGDRWIEYNFHSAVHEYAHWLIPGGHPYGGVTGEFNGWGTLYHSGDAICANTFERERVAWINPVEITTDILNAPLTDYISTGVAYKYHPPNGWPYEYYYFENHQKLWSTYDYATTNSNDKGIFVIHQKQYYSSENTIRCKPSNGQWDWDNPYNTTCWGNPVPAFEITNLNRNGRSNRDQLHKSGVGWEWLFALIDIEGEAQCGDWLHGAGLENAFKLDYNDVFSPYSNPSTHTWLNQQTNFTMELYDQNGSIINARFYLTDPIAGKPSKPYLGWYHPGTRPIKYGWIYLGWGADLFDGNPIEPDYQWSELQRKIGTGPWVTVYTGPNRIWWDGSITYDPNGDTPVYFRVRVRDSQGLWSLWSELFNTKMISIQEKIGVQTISNEKLTDYSLDQNYPNPFNPTTTISYIIPKNGFVTLKVFDILGREVTSLINEVKEAGNYCVTFNASELPSGIYFYTLSSGNFMETKKLILLK